MPKPLETITIRLAPEHLEAVKKLPPTIKLNSLVRTLLSCYFNAGFPNQQELEVLVVAEAERAAKAPLSTAFKRGHRPWNAGDAQCPLKKASTAQKPPLNPLLRVILAQPQP